MKKRILSLLISGAVLSTAGCSSGAYKGKINVGNDKEKTTASESKTKKEDKEKAMDSLVDKVKEMFGEDAGQIVEENKEEIIKGAEQIAG